MYGHILIKMCNDECIFACSILTCSSGKKQKKRVWKMCVIIVQWSFQYFSYLFHYVGFVFHLLTVHQFALFFHYFDMFFHHVSCFFSDLIFWINLRCFLESSWYLFGRRSSSVAVNNVHKLTIINTCLALPGRVSKYLCDYQISRNQIVVERKLKSAD